MFLTLHGVIARRILLNYRVDPEVVARELPPCFRPQLVAGHAIAGLCLIRLREIRPRGWPARFGLTSENAAHRVGVEWDSAEGPRQGVYIWRRDTNSPLNAWAGGRLFPGVHHRSTFRVRETAERFEIRVAEREGRPLLSLDAERTATPPATSTFASLAEASRFFEAGAYGYSRDSSGADCEGMELRSRTWNLAPLAVRSAESAFFEDCRRFPPGSIQLDSAWLMQNIEHEWRKLPTIHRSRGSEVQSAQATG